MAHCGAPRVCLANSFRIASAAVRELATLGLHLAFVLLSRKHMQIFRYSDFRRRKQQASSCDDGGLSRDVMFRQGQLTAFCEDSRSNCYAARSFSISDIGCDVNTLGISAVTRSATSA
jgi:hypothetical protein